MATNKSVFETLNAINCNGHTEVKNGLTYLSWAWAWQIVKTHYPTANYIIYENADGWNYFTDGRSCWVKTGVVIEGQEHIEMLPVMDYKNRSIPFDAVTSFDVNKSIQRSLTKACARHGLGLYIYAGEDLPATDPDVQEPAPAPVKPAKKTKPAKVEPAPEPVEEPAKTIDIETYWKIVKAYAENKPTKTGGNYRDLWMSMTKPDADKIAKFDHDVQNYKTASNIQ